MPRGEKDERRGGGLFEGEVVRNRDGGVLGGGEQFGIAAVDGVAEHGEAAAEVVFAIQALLALPATGAGRKQNPRARLDAPAKFAGGYHLARDIAAEHVGQGELHAGDAGADEEVEVIEGAGAHAHHDLVGT